jgi:hypothetical protein
MVVTVLFTVFSIEIVIQLISKIIILDADKSLKKVDEPEKTTGPSGCEAFLPLFCSPFHNIIN